MLAEGKLFSKINWSQGISAAVFGGKIKAISADQHPEGAVLKHTTTVQHLFCSRHFQKLMENVLQGILGVVLFGRHYGVSHNRQSPTPSEVGGGV